MLRLSLVSVNGADAKNNPVGSRIGQTGSRSHYNLLTDALEFEQIGPVCPVCLDVYFSILLSCSVNAELHGCHYFGTIFL